MLPDCVAVKLTADPESDVYPVGGAAVAVAVTPSVSVKPAATPLVLVAMVVAPSAFGMVTWLPTTGTEF